MKPGMSTNRFSLITRAHLRTRCWILIKGQLCGSVPIRLEHDDNDNYDKYARFIDLVNCHGIQDIWYFFCDG